MSIRGKEWDTIQIPYASGLDLKSDARASTPPHLDIAKNVQFDEIGGLQMRLPFGALSANILGGGTITNPRRLVENGNELVLFTDVGLYSWSPAASAWVFKATHLAVALDESPVFATTGDQIDADRAQLNGVIFYAWTNAVASGVTRVWVAAVDAATGAVLMAPTNPVGASNGTIPRLVALDSKVMLFWSNAVADLNAVPLDPATATIGTPFVVTASPTFSSGYDVCKVIGVTDRAVVVCMSNPTSSYQVTTVSPTAVVATLTVAKTAGVIACSSAPGGSSLVQVIRAPTNILLKGELINVSAMTVTYTDQAIATTSTGPGRIACAHRSTQDGGAYRCYAFWGEGEILTPTNITFRSNWVDTGGTIGTAVTLNRQLSPASRAFDYNGRVFLWTVYAQNSSVSFAGTTFRSSLQNSYFLYRDDGSLCAKACNLSASGFPATSNQLPSVQLVSGTTNFAWCGGTRRIINIGNTNSSGYSSRVPRDITFTFDSNDARRCARIGRTLYVAAGEILQYDGSGLYEVGFHTYPANSVPGAPGTAAGPADGKYDWKSTYSHVNAMGERDRSTSINTQELTLSLGLAANDIEINVENLHVTHRTQAATTGAAPLIEIWRTAVNPTADAPFYKVTSDDPSLGAVANNLVINDLSQIGITNGAGASGHFRDSLTDALLTARETNPENGAVLPCVAPPAASIILATQDRLFLAGIAGEPNRIWYSRLRNDGEVVSFNDALVIDVPKYSGDISALGYFNETLVVFCERGVFVIPGQGYDNLGGGQNFGPVHVASTDVGAQSHDGVCLTPMGLFFKSFKGWYLLDSRWTTQYVGAQVDDYNSDTVVSVHVMETRHEVRCLSTSRMLVYDYTVNQWGERDISDGIHATLWNGTYAYINALTALTERTDYTLSRYDMDVETAWIKLNELQGSGLVRFVEILGAFQSTCSVRLRIARDYERSGSGWAYYDDVQWTATTITPGDSIQFRHGPSRPKCSAIKVRITTVGATGEMIKLTGLALEYSKDEKLNRRLPAAQKV